MKLYVFHLMPYADLDLDFDKTHNSAWVTLPNSYYDPKNGHKLYNRYLDELEYADELGFDGICLNEHHQNAYGLMPIPGVIAGALARRTKRAKIAVLGRALPLLNNPLSVAEEFAMIDNITGGRLIAGFVRGIGAEYHSWSANPAHSYERYREAHDLIIRAWTETGPFPFEGKHYRFEYVNCWPRPYQQPHPPVWIPSTGSYETIEWAAAPERKYTYLQTFSPVAAIARYMTAYRQAADRHGYEATPAQLGWAVPTYVAETDAVAYAEAKPHIEAFLTKFLKIPPLMLLPPGYTSRRSLQGMIEARQTLADVSSIDHVLKAGMFLCGSPETIRAKIEEHQRTIGFGHLILTIQFGTLPHDLVMKSMTLFAKDVMPHLRQRAGAASPVSALQAGVAARA
jgi:alkanesulfonate monooxygenase SsuD/methylene tetrahydromethanopterin reductase-like flavin-dependent oxidoreductase (luciferase family)